MHLIKWTLDEIEDAAETVGINPVVLHQAIKYIEQKRDYLRKTETRNGNLAEGAVDASGRQCVPTPSAVIASNGGTEGDGDSTAHSREVGEIPVSPTTQSDDEAALVVAIRQVETANYRESCHSTIVIERDKLREIIKTAIASACRHKDAQHREVEKQKARELVLEFQAINFGYPENMQPLMKAEYVIELINSKFGLED